LQTGWISEAETNVVIGLSLPSIKAVARGADDAIVKIGFKVVAGFTNEPVWPPPVTQSGVGIDSLVPKHRRHEDASYIQKHCKLPIWHSEAAFIIAEQKPIADREVSVNITISSDMIVNGEAKLCHYFIVPIIEEHKDPDHTEGEHQHPIAATAPYFLDVWANDKIELSKMEDGWFRDFHVDDNFVINEDVVHNWLVTEGEMEGEEKQGAPKSRKKLEKKSRKKLEKKSRKKLEKKSRAKKKGEPR